jgi:thiol-disulfide isomerase/thioredoxin
MKLPNRKKKMMKSAYFWGIAIGIVCIILNVLALPIIYQHAENQVRDVDFSKLVVTRLDGETITLKELSNTKKVVANFWATWCRPCRVELPIMERAYQRIKQEYVFVMINDEEKESTMAYIEKHNYSFEFVQIDRSEFIKMGIIERPTTVILDANLGILSVTIGEIPQTDSEAFIESIIELE